MEFLSPHHKLFKKDVVDIARRFSLDPEKLTVEFITPNSQAILIEEFEDHDYKIHINLQENRIVSIQSLSSNGNGNGIGNGNGTSERWKEKYRPFMK